MVNDKRILIFISSIVIMTIISLSSCNSGTKEQSWHFKEFSFDGSAAIQTINGITVELEPLKAGSFYNYPELFRIDNSKIPEQLKAASEVYPPEKGFIWIHTFSCGKNFLPGLMLKITNNTNHILNLKNTRMYLKMDGGDSVMANTKLGDPTLVQVEDQQTKKYIWRPKSLVENDGSFVCAITKYEIEHSKVFEKTRALKDLQYPVGLSAEVVRQNMNRYKLLGDTDLEILPGTDINGILYFPAVFTDRKFTVKLCNLIPSANPDEKNDVKTNFEYRFKPDKEKVWGVDPVDTINSSNGQLCNITHESGTLNEYDFTTINKGAAANDVKGELAVEKTAALAGTQYGLRVMQGIGVSSGTELKTSATKKLARSRSDFYRVRFYFDTYTLDKNTQSMVELSRLIVLMPRSNPLWWLILNLDLKDGQFALSLGLRQDDWQTTGGYVAIMHNITSGKHMAELRCKKSSAHGVNDGMVELFIDGISVGKRNDVMRFENFELNRVEVGAYWSMSTLNSYLIDEIVIRDDDKPIGPVKSEK